MSDLVVSLPKNQELRDALGTIPGVRFIQWDMTGPCPEPQIDIVVPPYIAGNKLLTQLNSTDARLVQWQSIGYNGVEKYLPAGIPFANATSVHEASTAELTLALILASQRGLPDFIAEGLAHDWRPRIQPSLADRNILLIGYGGVAKAIEARLGGFEVALTRLARKARDDRNLAGEVVPIHAMSSLEDCLATCDIAIVALPLTEDTKGLINASALAAMPTGSLLVNIGRGPIVDTDALVLELQKGRLRAALDVTDPEPLAVDHPLWDCPGTLITPHVGGNSTAMLPRMAALIARQIRHLQLGEAPENIVIGAWKS
jgi:Phosphoglycerate dehydrogenase and related dehydrogenases